MTRRLKLEHKKKAQELDNDCVVSSLDREMIRLEEENEELKHKVNDLTSKESASKLNMNLRVEINLSSGTEICSLGSLLNRICYFPRNDDDPRPYAVIGIEPDYSKERYDVGQDRMVPEGGDGVRVMLKLMYMVPGADGYALIKFAPLHRVTFPNFSNVVKDIEEAVESYLEKRGPKNNDSMDPNGPVPKKIKEEDSKKISDYLGTKHDAEKMNYEDVVNEARRAASSIEEGQ